MNVPSGSFRRSLKVNIFAVKILKMRTKSHGKIYLVSAWVFLTNWNYAESSFGSEKDRKHYILLKNSERCQTTFPFRIDLVQRITVKRNWSRATSSFHSKPLKIHFLSLNKQNVNENSRNAPRRLNFLVHFMQIFEEWTQFYSQIVNARRNPLKSSSTKELASPSSSLFWNA